LGATALIYALKNRNLGLASELLEAGQANASIATHEGITPLMLACMIPSLAMARILWIAGTRLTATTDQGFTALHYAANANCPELVQFLCETEPALTNMASYDGKTGLLIACENNDLTSVAKLLDCGAMADPAPIRAQRKDEDQMIDEDEENESELTGEVPVVAASRFGDLALIKLLAENGANLNAISPSDGSTALINAVSSQNEGLVRFLLGAEASPNIPSPEFAYPIYIAAQFNNASITQLLCEHGAALDVQPLGGDSFSALGEASRLGFVAVVRILLNFGASPSVSTNDKTSPLHAASFEGFDEIVRLLVSSNSSIVNAKDIDGVTPLMLGAQENRVDVIKTLLEANANIDESDNTGSTALMVAVGSNHVESVSALLQASPDLSLRNNRGCTVLWISAASGNESIAQMLLSNGASVSDRSNDGHLPIEIAQRLGHQNIVNLLAKVPVSIRTE